MKKATPAVAMSFSTGIVTYQAVSIYLLFTNRIAVPLIKITVLLMVLFLTMRAGAQCNTFVNADAANPILHAKPVPQNINGLFFVDIDGDGDLDCYIGGTFGATNPGDQVMRLYRNIGTPKRPQYELSTTTGFVNPAAAGNGPFAFVDIDGDGDYDAFVTSLSPDMFPYEYVDFFRNEGTAQNPVFVEDQTHNPVPQPNFYSQAWITEIAFANMNSGHMDDNKTPDFFISYLTTLYEDPPIEQAYLNSGTLTNATFSLYTQEFGNMRRVYYDWNKDGIMDYFIENSYYQGEQATLYTPAFMLTTTNAPVFWGNAPSNMVDLNNDGSPETFDAQGHYATLAPVAAIKVVHISNSFHTKDTRLVNVITSDRYKYSWERNNKLLPGQNKPYLDVTEPGVYVLYVTGFCGIGVSLPYYNLVQH